MTRSSRPFYARAPRQTEAQRIAKHGRLLPMDPRVLAEAMGDYSAAGIELPLREQNVAPFSPTGEAGAANLPNVPAVFSMRSAGVAAAMLLAIVLFITLIGVLQHG